MNFREILFITLLSTFFFINCSSLRTIPTEPESPDISGSENFLGGWTAQLDLESMTAEIIPDREMNAWFKVSAYLPSPIIHINSWDSLNSVIDVDVTISNQNVLHADGYDLRLIIYTDSIGRELITPDNFTTLFDIPGGLNINPFRAYAKTQPSRKFAWQSSYTENLKIKCPSGNFTVRFAIEASFPSNCSEPYMIDNFTQLSELYDQAGSSVELSVNVFDWQNDVNLVTLICPQITDEPETSFIFLSGNQWTLSLINNTGAPAGEYSALIKATSMGSSSLVLYDMVKIFVTEKPQTKFAFPVGYPDASGYSLDEYDGRSWMDYLNPYGYHLGDDWTKIGGGDNDCGDPVYAIADGVVTYAQDYFGVWGNIVMIKHENVDGTGTITSYYSHLTNINVSLNDTVTAGQVIGTIGDNHGRYYCHLHFEIRQGNRTEVGVAFTPTIVTEGPYGQIDPSAFINAHYGP